MAVLENQKQGRSHAFESEGAQSPKAILGPFCLKKWEGPSLLLLLYGQKSGGAQAPPGPLYWLRPCSMKRNK